MLLLPGKLIIIRVWSKSIAELYQRKVSQDLSRYYVSEGSGVVTAGLWEISSSELREGIAIGDVDLMCSGSQYSMTQAPSSITHDFDSGKTDEWRWCGRAQRGYDDSAHKTGSNDRVEAENAVG